MKTLQKVTSVFLAVIFLVSSLGFTANKMVCLKSGKTKLSLVHVKDCCPEKKSSLPVVKADCCDITNTFFNLCDFQNGHKLQVNKPSVIQSFCLIPDFFANKQGILNQSVFSLADLPPPFSGRKILSFISILII
jgi:hypothetical protein